MNNTHTCITGRTFFQNEFLSDDIVQNITSNMLLKGSMAVPRFLVARVLDSRV